MTGTHNEEVIENKTYDEISIGDEAFLEKRLTMEDIKLFAIMSGDVNPAHVDDDFAKSSRFQEIIAHGMWGGALISTVLGTKLPGPGTVYLGQTLAFKAPVMLGDVLRVIVRVDQMDDKRHHIVFACRCENQRGDTVIEGEARVLVPTKKVSRQRTVMPEVRLSERGQLHAILTAADHPDPMHTAVVHPVDDSSIRGAVASAKQQLIIPTLVGPRDKILAAADTAEVDIQDFEIVDTPHSHAAAERAVQMARAGQIEALMKGALHTD